MTESVKERGAVLQLEVDIKRWNGIYDNDFSRHNDTTINPEKPLNRVKYLARTAVNDTIRNGGTFVLVVTADKITMIQRPDAEEI